MSQDYANTKVAAPSPATPNETIDETVSVPLKYHDFISQHNFLRALRSFGVAVDTSAPTGKYVPPTRPSNDAVPARIDDADDDASASRSVEWQVAKHYQDSSDGETVWTLKARDEESLTKAKNAIAEAIKEAERASMVGFLTLPDRAAFPRIVGTKGANVSRLRAETGTEITVSKDTNTITIVGSESSIEEAKAAILRIASYRGGRRHD